MFPKLDSLSQYIDFPDQILGLCGAKIKLTANNIIANIGIKIIKKVVLVIYKLKIINANILAKLNNSSGININNVINSVITDIDKLNEVDITM